MSMPHNLDAEQSLLGILLFDSGAYERVEGVVRPDQFFEPFHERLFQTICDANTAGRAVTPELMVTRFRGDKAFEDLGGIRYLNELSDKAPMTTLAGQFAAEIAQAATLRDLVRLADGLRQHALKGDLTADKIITVTEQYLADVARGAGVVDYWQTGHALADQLSGILDGSRKAQYVPSGLYGFDARLGGLRKGRMTIEAGRPGMGKSALAVQRMLNMARQGYACAMFSLEMDIDELALRLGAAAAFRPDQMDESPIYFEAQRGGLSDRAHELMARGGQLMRELPIFFDDRSGLTPSEMAPAAKRLIRRWEKDGLAPGMVVVDHLHIVAPDVKTGNRVVEVGEVSAAFRDAAKATGVAFLALCQLSRASEARTNVDKEPQMSDLRWSGEIEADANTITFIHRPEKYLKEPDNKADLDAMDAYLRDMDQWRGKALLKNVKNRGGPSDIRHVVNVSLPHNAFWE